MYFTTIENLRASHAMKQRVEALATSLAKIYPVWTPTMAFPIAEVHEHNGAADMNWVVDVVNTHIATRFDQGITAQLKEAMPNGDSDDFYRNPKKMVAVIDLLLAEARIFWRTNHDGAWYSGERGTNMADTSTIQSSVDVILEPQAVFAPNDLVERVLALNGDKLAAFIARMNQDGTIETRMDYETAGQVRYHVTVFKQA